jgi:hypothetical protein
MRFSGGIRFAVAMAMVLALALCSAVYAAGDAQIARDNDAKHPKAVPTLSVVSLTASPLVPSGRPKRPPHRRHAKV